MHGVEELLAGLQRGEARAAARLISRCERSAADAAEVARRIFPLTGRAEVVGITGSPGTGKSTLVDRLIEHARAEGRTVGVIAVDPSSPFTGGAILGDRVRMQKRATDPGVFIRSMGTRGHLGGLARATHDAVRVLDAMGKDLVVVETVGVGQGEVDVVRTADTVVVVTAPGLGDEVQAIKAGIMEIGDVFVVNKADRDGADKTAAELDSMVRLGEELRPGDHDAMHRTVGTAATPAPASSDAWRAPVLKASAEKGQGVPEVAQALADHRAWQQRTGQLQARRRAAREAEVLEILKAGLVARVLDEAALAARFHDALARVERKHLDPYAAAEELLGSLGT